MAAPQEKAKGLFTRDISIDGLLRVYGYIKKVMTGKIALKLHTEEPHGSTILPREMGRAFQVTIHDSAIVECNVLSPSPR